MSGYGIYFTLVLFYSVKRKSVVQGFNWANYISLKTPYIYLLAFVPAESKLLLNKKTI